MNGTITEHIILQPDIIIIQKYTVRSFHANLFHNWHRRFSWSYNVSLCGPSSSIDLISACEWRDSQRWNRDKRINKTVGPRQGPETKPSSSARWNYERSMPNSRQQMISWGDGISRCSGSVKKKGCYHYEHDARAPLWARNYLWGSESRR